MNACLKASGSALLLLAVACGNDKSGTPVYSSGVDAGADASVSTLNTDQRQALCSSREAFVQTNVNLDVVVQAVCLTSALIVGGTPDDCQATFDRCVANNGSDVGFGLNVGVTFNGPGSNNNVSSVVCAQQLADCNASVSDLEGCVNVNTGIVYRILDTLSCRGAGQADTTNEAKTLRSNMGAGVCSSVGTRCGGFGEPLL